MTKISTTIAKLTKFSYIPERKLYIIDVAGKPLGRVATKIASLLIGKHKPIFSKDKDCGDYVIAINASKIVLTGKKLYQKIYFRHSGYLGGDKYIPYLKLLPHKADFILKEAVKGMLPKNKLRKKMLKRLKVYLDDKFKTSMKDYIQIK